MKISNQTVRKIIVATTGLVLASCSNHKAPEMPAPKAEINDQSAQVVAGEVLVQGDETKIRQALSEMKAKFELTKVTANGNLFLAKYNNTELAPQQLSTQLQGKSGIEFAEPNFIVQAEDVPAPKDPFFNMQWALSNLGQDAPRGASGEEGADLGALKAWELTKGSHQIIVGVVDTGVDYLHPDLAENAWINELEKAGIPGKDDDNNGFTDDVYGWDFVSLGRDKPFYGQLGDNDPMDDNSHGTHCAGIIGAVPGNLQGVAGINWKVKIMALKFMNKRGSGSTLDAYRAIIYGVDNGVNVLSNSWGGGQPTQTMAQAVKYALEKGVLFVAAAGNDGTNNDLEPKFPAGYPFPNVLSVAASNNKDRPASFTNYGFETVHVAAPGVDILSTIPRSMAQADSRAYASYSGTSMATPYVAGAAALVLAYAPEMKGKGVELKERLLASVDRIPLWGNKVSSGGRLNVFRALKNERNPVSESRATESESVAIVSPNFNQEKFDIVWKIHKAGAKRLRVNFDYAMVDIGYDLLALYDQNYQLITKFEAESPVAINSPWIEGDTAYVRFANSVIRRQTEEEKSFDRPEDAFAAGATFCQGQEGGKSYLCYIYKLSDPYPNFDSQGIKISRFEYQN